MKFLSDRSYLHLERLWVLFGAQRKSTRAIHVAKTL